MQMNSKCEGFESTCTVCVLRKDYLIECFTSDVCQVTGLGSAVCVCACVGVHNCTYTCSMILYIYMYMYMYRYVCTQAVIYTE